MPLNDKGRPSREISREFFKAIAPPPPSPRTPGRPAVKTAPALDPAYVAEAQEFLGGHEGSSRPPCDPLSSDKKGFASDGEKKNRVMVDLTSARQITPQVRPVVDLTGGRMLSSGGESVDERGRRGSTGSSVLSFATVPEHMLKNANNNAVAIPAAPPCLTQHVKEPIDFRRLAAFEEEGDSSRRHLPSQPSATSSGWPTKDNEGPRGEYYDPSAVRFFYGKRWSDGMCDAAGKPLTVLLCCVPLFWPFLLSSAAVRARPLIFSFGSSYVQMSSPWRIRFLILVECMLSLCFVVGVVIAVMESATEETETIFGLILTVVGIPGPILWGLTLVAIRNRYRIRESVCSTFLKATLCPCLFIVRVKRHVDQAQGFKKPKGLLQEALWAASERDDTVSFSV